MKWSGPIPTTLESCLGQKSKYVRLFQVTRTVTISHSKLIAEQKCFQLLLVLSIADVLS